DGSESSSQPERRWRKCLQTGWRSVGIATWRTANRVNDFVDKAQTLQGPNDEASGGELVLQTRVRFETLFGVNTFAVRVNDVPQRLCPVGGQTGLHQQFDPGHVVDFEFALNPVPEG